MTMEESNVDQGGYMDEGIIEFSDQDLKDLEQLGVTGGDLPEFHPVLHVWRAVLEPARELRKEKVTPQYASKMVQSYPGLTYPDTAELQDRYYAKVIELLEILEFEIGSDAECLSPASPEEDVAENSDHYRAMLLTWQQAFLQWELEWTCTDADAAIELAAISEVHKMFFGQTGLTAFLDNIKFEYTEADSASLSQALDEQRARFFELEEVNGE